MRRISHALFVSVLLLVGACAPGPAGHLLIAGGGTKDDNEPLYSQFLAHTGPSGRIGVFPTASGVENPGATSAATIRKFTGGREVVVIPLTKDAAAAANDPAIAEQIRSCSALWFVGGVQSRILAVFRPSAEAESSAAYRATLEVLAKGGSIGGTSAGAAMMSDPMITGGTSALALANGIREDSDDDRGGVGIARGMGYFPFGLTDQHFLQRGRLGRLIVALDHTRQRLGFGISENCAIAVDRKTGIAEVVGREGLVLVDRREVNRTARVEGALAGWTGLRISLLSTGDKVDCRSGRVTVAADRKYMESPKERGADPAPEPDVWKSKVVSVLLHRLAANRYSTVVGYNETHELRLRADSSTRFYVGTDGADNIIAVDVLADLVPRK